MERIFCGVDFHKNESVICALYQDGSAVEGIRTIKSSKLVEYFSNKGNWEIGIEASGGTNDMVTRLRALGLTVKLINSNKFRGIGIGGKKTDQRDAKALAECLRVGFAPEVFVRSPYARQLKSLIVSREMFLRSRVNMMNHIRGTLKEYGVVMPVGPEKFFIEVGQKVAGLENAFIRGSLEEMLSLIRDLLEKQKSMETRIKEVCINDARIERLKSIPGVGDLVSTMTLAVVDDIKRFKNAREFSSYLGLVPKVHASANVRMMGSITRSGSEILRRYLIHGARAWMRYDAKGDSNREWAEKIKERRGMNKAIVALAHRMARIIFAVLRDESFYRGKKKKKHQAGSVVTSVTSGSAA